MWSRKYPACITCGRTDRKHFGKGECRRCYLKKYNAANLDSVRKLRKKWYVKNIVGTDRQKVARDQRNFDGQRDRILARDGHKCVRCPATKGLVVHHKDRTGRNKPTHNNSDDNLETLCRKCHAAEHREELQAAKAAAKPTTCKRGHPMTAEYGRHAYGQWRCRVCENIRAAKYRAAKKNK